MSDFENKDEPDEMSISEIAELLGISQSTLRYYEEEGLIKPSRSENSGYRKYSLLSLIELTDVIRYRNLGIPVKKIHPLMNASAQETAAAIDKAFDEAIAQLHQINQKLEMFSLYDRRIRKYIFAQSSGYCIVDEPEINRLYPFGLKDVASMYAYLKSPRETESGLFFSDAKQPLNYIDCVTRPVTGHGETPLWKRESHSCLYLKCLMKTAYCYSERNDLPEHLAYMHSQGMEPGSVIAQYLTFDYTADGERHDFYLAWIEIRSTEDPGKPLHP